VITQQFPSAASGARRSTVCWIMELSPCNASTCLARALRLRGQNRVPLPPAKITGANFGPAKLSPAADINTYLTLYRMPTAIQEANPDRAST
jgi:hypothetical protein